MIKKLFYLFVFFAPFTSFFALSAWLRLPVIINQVLFVFVIVGMLMYGKIKIKMILKEDLLVLAFLGLVWLTFLLGFREKRSFNHTLAYTNAIIFFYFLSKYVILNLKVTSKQISKVIYWSFIASSIIIISDFILINFFNFSLRELYTVKDGKISNMDYYIRSGFLRVGGVAEEPGTMALFYNIYFGISLYYMFLIKKKQLHIFILFLVSHFAMFSNAGIMLSFVAFFIIFLFNKMHKLTISRNQIIWILVILFSLILAIFLIVFFDTGNIRGLLEVFFNKVFFNEGEKSYSSSGQRLIQWSRALKNFISHPLFGSGPGFGVNEDPEGYLSVYLTILADLGVFAFIFFIGFLEAIFKKVMSMPIQIRSFLLFTVITSILHLTIVSDFYHAPIWILFAFIQLVYQEKKANLL